MNYNYMLFRTNKGNLIEIKKYDFSNDKLYYQKLMEIKKLNISVSKETNISYSNKEFGRLN